MAASVAFSLAWASRNASFVTSSSLWALQVGLGQGDFGLRGQQVGLCMRQDSLKGTRIDGEEHVALVHELAVAEVDLLDDAGNLGADLHAVDGADAAGKLIPFGHRFLQDPGDGDGHRRRSGAGGRGGRFARGRDAGNSEQARGPEARRDSDDHRHGDDEDGSFFHAEFSVN
jgi:hypothetical protein